MSSPITTPFLKNLIEEWDDRKLFDTLKQLLDSKPLDAPRILLYGYVLQRQTGCSCQFGVNCNCLDVQELLRRVDQVLSENNPFAKADESESESITMIEINDSESDSDSEPIEPVKFRMRTMFPSLKTLSSYTITTIGIEYKKIDTDGFPLLTNECVEITDVMKVCMRKKNWDKRMKCAAKLGNLELVKFMVVQGYKTKANYNFDWEYGTECAVNSGVVEVVEFMVEQGTAEYIRKGIKNLYNFNWGYRLFDAAEKGDISMVKFIIEQGRKEKYYFSWDDTLPSACMSGNRELVDLIIEKGYESDSSYIFNWGLAMFGAISSGNKSLVEFILGQGRKEDPNYYFDWEEAMLICVIKNNIPMAQFVIEQAGDYKFDWEYAMSCKYHVEPEIIKFIESKM